MVMRHAATESTSARDALGELAGRYWYPVYIYVRRCGHAPEAAGNIARRFLQHLLREVDERTPSRRRALPQLPASRLHTFLAAGSMDEAIRRPSRNAGRPEPATSATISISCRQSITSALLLQ
jgi:hypothetical protein